MAVDPDEVLFDRYQAYMVAHEFAQAADVMRAARDDARAQGSGSDAAWYGALTASALAIAGDHGMAEAAYLGAVADDPSDALLKLRFANFLLDSLNEPTRALDVIEPALPQLRADRSTYHDAESSLGTIYVALGRLEDAARTFRDLARPEVLPGSEPRAYDFRLVTALVANKVMLAECLEYAEHVQALATEQDDHDTLAVTRKAIDAILRARMS